VRCDRCGVETTWPIPSDADLDRAYGDWYRPSSGRFTGLGDHVLRRLRSRLAARLDQIAPPGPVLDVGAGDGALLDALAAQGREAVGLERRSTRPDVRAAELAEISERWAAIVFWHSLEHLRDPGPALDRAAELLVFGGVIVVAIPNPASIQARLFGDRWLALDMPRHLAHVPAAALLARLRSAGMSPQRVSYLRGGQVVFGWLHGIIGSLPGRPDLYDAIRRPDARQAPISSGRRALTLMAGALALPLAIVAALLEAWSGRAGTVYVEARRN
jgi:Methyltransferase domain